METSQGRVEKENFYESDSLQGTEWKILCLENITRHSGIFLLIQGMAPMRHFTIL